MKLSVNLPNSGRGVEVEIPGIGLVKNGQTIEVTDEQELTFRTIHGHMEEGGFALGPTLRQAKLPEGVKVGTTPKPRAKSKVRTKTKVAAPSVDIATNTEGSDN